MKITPFSVVGGSAAVLLLLLSSRGGGGSITSKNTTDRWGNTLYRDTTALLPAFTPRVQVLFNRMRARGFKPRLWEAYRTPERAIKLAEEGKGVENSMHIYGAAVDVIDADAMWSNPAFFRALGEEAESLGLTWGGRFTRVDMPHIQAIPFRSHGAFTRMTPDQREVFVKGLYV